MGNSQNPNARTLAYYDEKYEDYTQFWSKMPASTGLNKWVEDAFKKVPKTAKIIEIGSGFGRDADFIESLGYTVERTDATQGFVSLLQADGHPARLFNLMTDNFDKSYDIVFAQAVLLHFPKLDFEAALQKIHNALVPGGLLAFSVRKGNGETWVQNDGLGPPRYFYDWDFNPLLETLQKAGFGEREIRRHQFGNSETEWLLATARKRFHPR